MNLLRWLTAEDLKNLYSYEYWNDLSEEKNKAWWINSEQEIFKVINYLNESGLKEEFDILTKFLKDESLLKGKVLDVAAGVCWTSALLSKEKEVNHIDALEFSLHRINDIAPRVINGLKGDSSKIQRILGSFYDIQGQNYDLIFMSQAFHHAEKPLNLLLQCDKALKPNGTIALMGEHLINTKRYIRRIIKTLIKDKKIEVEFYKLFKPDDILGDHYYRLSDYYFMFQSLGYSVNHFETNIRGSMVLIATKE